MSCPLDCRYLQEGRKFEKPPHVHDSDIPNQDVQINEAFLAHNEPLLLLMSSAIAVQALGHNAIDSDVKEALASLVQSWRTLESGLLYKAEPQNPIAARIAEGVREAVESLRTAMSSEGLQLRDPDLMKIFVFLQRLEIRYNNRRPKGRAFIDLLRAFMPPSKEEQKPPGEPGIILTP
ncbi:MAG TPA: hypothetical protein VES20_14540 [Bryobacteraceae bacterium]|nr:hypothetical protein [Bryobacteraceae bacterium]